MESVEVTLTEPFIVIICIGNLTKAPEGNENKGYNNLFDENVDYSNKLNVKKG